MRPTTHTTKDDAIKKAFYSASRPGVVTVPVDFPDELLRAIDGEAVRLGLTRQAYITQRFEWLLPPK